MRFNVALTTLLATLLATSATASVDAVVTRSTADVTLSKGIYSFSGEQLAGSINDTTPSGGSYDAVSDVVGPEILFKNGNFSSGGFATVSSFTSLDVTFTNDSTAAVRPSFHSTLLPAGLGLLVGSGCGAGPVRDCAEALLSPYGFEDLPFSGHNTSLIAQSTFDFRILSDDVEVFTLSGSVSLLYDRQLDRNVLITDLTDAAAVLDGFTQVANSKTANAYAWDATEILLDLPGIMNVGDTRVLTYETGVTTFSQSPKLGCAGAIAFSAFGDPIGRNGSIPPPSAERRVGPSAVGCDAGTVPGTRPPVASNFRFATPTFVNGVLSLELLPPFGGTIPEPATWAMMVIGFGFAGTAMRRGTAAQRRLAPAA